MDLSIISVTKTLGCEIEATISSVLEQEPSPLEYELLVICGGVASESQHQLISDLTDVALYGYDSGIYHAMNAGIECARGNFVIFLNGGDILASKNVLARSAQLIRNTNCDVILGDVVEWLRPRIQRYKRAKSIESIRYGMPTSHQSMFFRNNAALRYREDLIVAGDYCLLAEHVAKGSIVATLPFAIAECAPRKTSADRWLLAMRESYYVRREVLKEGQISNSYIFLRQLALNLMVKVMPSHLRVFFQRLQTEPTAEG